MQDFTYPSLSLVSTGFSILLKQPIIPSVFVILSVTRPLSTQDLFWEKYNVLADALNPASPLISEFNTIAEITSNPSITITDSIPHSNRDYPL